MGIWGPCCSCMLHLMGGLDMWANSFGGGGCNVARVWRCSRMPVTATVA